MRHVIILLTIGILYAGCQNKDKTNEIRNKIQSYKAKISSYEKKLDTLEKQLAQINDTATVNLYQVPVKVKNLKYEKFNHYFNVNGEVEARQNAFISPEMSGQIEKIYVNEGERVTKNELLVKLKTDVTQSTINEVQTNLDLAKKMFQKQERLWEKDISSEVQYLEAKNRKESLEAKLQTLQEQLQMAHIRAPFNGIVDKIFLKEGELASPGVRIIRFVNLQNLDITANIAERYLARVNEGDTVFVKFTAYPSLNKRIPIARKGNIIDENSRTFEIEVNLRNPNELLKPNMLASIRINDYTDDSAFVVPTHIIKKDMEGSYLYTIKETKEGTVAKKTYITRGITYQSKTEIRNGLNKDQKVIITGYSNVSDGAKVSIK